jgi:hypothetical protein
VLVERLLTAERPVTPATLVQRSVSQRIEVLLTAEAPVALVTSALERELWNSAAAAMLVDC